MCCQRYVLASPNLKHQVVVLLYFFYYFNNSNFLLVFHWEIIVTQSSIDSTEHTVHSSRHTRSEQDMSGGDAVIWGHLSFTCMKSKKYTSNILQLAPCGVQLFFINFAVKGFFSCICFCPLTVERSYLITVMCVGRVWPVIHTSAYLLFLLLLSRDLPLLYFTHLS